METRTQNVVLIATLIVLDSIMILAGWWLAFHLRISSDILPSIYSVKVGEYQTVLLLALPIWIGIFALCRLYNRDELLGGPQEYGNVVKACLIGFAALIAVSTFLRMPDLARGWLVLGLVLTTLLVGLARFLTRRVFYSLRSKGWFVQRALIVGTNDDARAIARQLMPARRTGVEVVGFVDDFLPVNTPVVGTLSVVAATPMLQAVARDQNIDQVILVSGAMTWESLDSLLRGITVTNKDRFAIKVSPGLYETLTTGVRVSYKNRVPLLEIERAPITGIDLLLKTVLDFSVGLVLLPLTLLLSVGVVLGLVLLGRRPILQASRIMGKNGQVFKSYLFASCRPDEPAWEHGAGFGRFLYETGLEKIPQVLNLLTGKMSLVGPRPVDPKNAAQYEEWLPNLLSLKPGMTGARASSPVNVISLDQEMRLELYYARNYSIWLDLQILFQTLVRILKRERVVREKPQTEAVGPNAWQLATITASRNDF